MARWGTLVIDERIEAMLERLEPARFAVAEHEVFQHLDKLPNLRVFMEHHVFAVWDFMSLLTVVRNHVTGTRVPWRPTGSPRSRRFVNELILSEESDEIDGAYTSHLEMYVEAMAAVGADTGPIHRLLAACDDDVETALLAAGAPATAQDFVRRTWDALAGESPARAIGAFAFGRESLIPSMFTSLRRLVVEVPAAKLFCDYLDRHIDLDGSMHTSFAFELVVAICRDDHDKWMAVEASAERALLARRSLWNGIVAELDRARAASSSVPA